MKRPLTNQQIQARRGIIRQGCFIAVPMLIYFIVAHPSNWTEKSPQIEGKAVQTGFNHDRNDKIAIRFEIGQVEIQLANNTRRMMIMEYNHHGGREYIKFRDNNDSLMQLRDSLKSKLK